MLRITLILMLALATAQLANTSDVDSHGHAKINKTLNAKLSTEKSAANKVFISEEDLAQEITQALKSGRKIDKKIIENYNQSLGSCDIDYNCAQQN